MMNEFNRKCGFQHGYDPNTDRTELSEESQDFFEQPLWEDEVVDVIDICNNIVVCGSIDSVSHVDIDNMPVCGKATTLKKTMVEFAEKNKVDINDLSWVYIMFDNGRTLWLPDYELQLFDFLAWAIHGMDIDLVDISAIEPEDDLNHFEFKVDSTDCHDDDCPEENLDIQLNNFLNQFFAFQDILI